MRLLATVTALVAALFTSVVGLPQGAAAAAPVTKTLAVVVVQNGDTDKEKAQLADTGYLQNVFFGGSSSLAAWMPTVSHGLLHYAPAGAGIFVVQPNDALLNGDKTTCLKDAARATAEDYLRDQSITRDATAVVFDVGVCPWAGLGEMPGKFTWFTPKPSLDAIVHEFGHNQGYPHEEKTDCPNGTMSGCKPNGYSGNTPMGSGGAGRGYSSVELLHSGWLEPGWLVQAAKPGAFTLTNLYSPVSSQGTRVLEYKASAIAAYIFETRARTDSVDSSISNPGIRAYLVTIDSKGKRDYRNARMINPKSGGNNPNLPTGTTLTDTANKLVITVRSGTSVVIAALAPAPSASAPASASPEPSTSALDSASPSPSDDDTVIAADAPTTRTSAFRPSRPWLLLGGGLLVIALFALWLFRHLGSRSRGRHAGPG